MATPEWIESAANAGRKRGKPIDNFGDALNAVAAPLQLSPAELWKAGRTVIRLAAARHRCDLTRRCTHQQHAADMDAAREVLQAIGIIPTRSNLQRFGDGVRNRVYGTCPSCRRRKPVDMDGVMGPHGDAVACPGGGRKPLETT